MKARKQKLFLFVLITGLGLWSMSIQKKILDTGVGTTGVRVEDSPELWMLGIITVVYLLAAAWMTRLLGASGNYRDNFPSCFFSGTASMVAGVLMLFSGINALVPGQAVMAGSSIAAGCAMILCGLCRISGRKPVWWLDFLVCCAYGARLILRYRAWNATPLIHTFIFPMLATAALTMFSLHRARCAADVMDRKRMVFFGFAGLYLCFLAMPGAADPGFYFASGVWCAGGMCELRRLEQPPVPEMPEQPPETA